MSTHNTSGYLVLVTAEEIPAHRRVKIDSNGKAALAGVDVAGVGVSEFKAASGAEVTIRLFNAPGTFFVTAAGAVTRGNKLYAKADGKVDDAGDVLLPLVAKEAATADNDVIEGAPNVSAIVATTADALTSTDGTAAAAADLAALKAEAEKIGDDVRSLHAKLIAAGVLIAP
jgi:hypothetical protein